MKNTFASKTFAAKTFASGHWTGVGVESTATTPDGVDYAAANWKAHYKTSDWKPHFAAANMRPDYTVK